MGRAATPSGEMTFSSKDEKLSFALFGSFLFNLKDKIKIKTKDREMCDLQRETRAKEHLRGARCFSQHAACFSSQNGSHQPSKWEAASSPMRKLRLRKAE